ncbi:UNVERIFIED_CONTAM: hypothetical protein GTU68_031191 [Idotea baltica]|nr:hypothetical protein [Idotea baltica]
MNRTELTDIHENLGAKMVEFAGYLMPLSYTTISEEHMTVRQHVGVFDVSHMGEFIVGGPESILLVDYVTSNNVAQLEVGQAQYSCLPNAEGGIVDDLLVYRLSDDPDGHNRYMLVVNASNIEKDFEWITTHNSFDAQCVNLSDDMSLLAVQGPKAHALIQELTSDNLEMEYYHFKELTIAGKPEILISATGYTGSGGYEIYIKNEDAPAIWAAIYALLPKYNGTPIGLGARDTLRLEMGFCLYGNDIDDTTLPLEAGLGWITKLKHTNFVGRDVILAAKSKGLQRKLVAFKMGGRRVARHGYDVMNTDGQKVGYVTSGSMSPMLEQPIGLAYVPKEMAATGQPIRISTGKKELEGQIVKLPFIEIPSL